MARWRLKPESAQAPREPLEGCDALWFQCSRKPQVATLLPAPWRIESLVSVMHGPRTQCPKTGSCNLRVGFADFQSCVYPRG